jgi:hypothetical protein
MKTEIIGIFVCMILLASALPAVGTVNNEYQKKTYDNTSLNSGWINTYGGDGKEAADSIYQSDDGGYIIIGETTSMGAGDRDIWLFKLDAFGDIEWETTFGGSEYDRGKTGFQTGDGGYILIGYTASYGVGNYDMWVIKTNTEGVMEWDATYGGSEIEEGVCIQPTSDGGYILGGMTGSSGAGKNDAWLVKINEIGDVLWDVTYGGPENEACEWVQETSDGGFISTGYCTSNFSDNLRPDAFVLKTDASGEIEWEHILWTNNFDLGHSVQQTPDGDFIITGWMNAGKYFYGDVFLLKLDAEGETVWEKTIGKQIISEAGLWIDNTDDGGYIISGCSGIIIGGVFSWSIPGVPLLVKCLLIKTDADGNVEWNKKIGPLRSMSRSVQQTDDGGFIIAGNTGSHHNTIDALVIKTDSNGDIN